MWFLTSPGCWRAPQASQIVCLSFRTFWQVPNSTERKGLALKKTHLLQGRIKDNKYTSWRSFTQNVLFLAALRPARVIIPPCSGCVQQLFSGNLLCLSSNKLKHLRVCASLGCKQGCFLLRCSSEQVWS